MMDYSSNYRKYYEVVIMSSYQNNALHHEYVLPTLLENFHIYRYTRQAGRCRALGYFVYIFRRQMYTLYIYIYGSFLTVYI